ncbi:hypothetical protein FQZ97_1077630 [compost metagenome]
MITADERSIENTEIGLYSLERLIIKRPVATRQTLPHVPAKQCVRKAGSLLNELIVRRLTLVIQNPGDALPVLEEILLQQRQNLVAEDQLQPSL